MSCYVTYMAELIRQIRKGSASGYARANLANLGFLHEAGAIVRDDAAGTYAVDVRKDARARSTPWPGDTFACRATATTPARCASSRR